MYMLYIIYPCIHHHSMSSLVSDAFCCVRSMISCVRSSHDLCARACTRTELRGNSKTKEGYSAGHPATDIFFRLELNPPRGHPATDQRNFIIINWMFTLFILFIVQRLSLCVCGLIIWIVSDLIYGLALLHHLYCIVYRYLYSASHGVS